MPALSYAITRFDYERLNAASSLDLFNLFFASSEALLVLYE